MKGHKLERVLLGAAYLGSAGMSIAFAALFGADSSWKFAFGAFAIGIDALKVIAWTAVSRGKAAMVILGFLCSLFAVGTVALSALINAEKGVELAQEATRTRQVQEANRALADRQSLILLDKLELSKRVSSIEKTIQLSAEISRTTTAPPAGLGTEVSQNSTGVDYLAVGAVAKRYGWKTELVPVFVYVAISIIIEIGIVSLSLMKGVLSERVGKTSLLKLGERPTRGALLKHAVNPDGSLVARRILEKVGVNERHLRALIASMKADGTLVRIGRGQRLAVAKAQSPERVSWPIRGWRWVVGLFGRGGKHHH